MKNEIYKNCKAILKQTAKEAKEFNKGDKPYIRMTINDQADQLHRQIDFYFMKGKFSEKVADLYKNWLSSYACKLHP
jgi:hypothetical protein